MNTPRLRAHRHVPLQNATPLPRGLKKIGFGRGSIYEAYRLGAFSPNVMVCSHLFVRLPEFAVYRKGILS